MSDSKDIQVYEGGGAVQQSAPHIDLMQDDVIKSIERVASILMQAQASVPDYLRKSKGDCFSVAMQALTWRLNPFVVASCSHITKSGIIGYNAQLINSVVLCNGPVVNRPSYEFFGEWGKILGKVKEMTGKSGGKYYVQNWDKRDEDGLGVRMSWQILGDTNPVSMQVLLKQCWPRFSTQWATDPQQQIIYAAGRKFARRYFPDVLSGVYATDELDQASVPSGPIINKPINVAPNINKDGVDIDTGEITTDANNDDLDIKLD